jgi:hypothetical protein
MAHVVTVPLVVAYQADGSQVYRYVGQTLPDTLADGEVERLLEGGFVEEIPDPVEEVEPPAPADVAGEKPLDQMTKAELEELAAAEGVDLANTKTNADKAEAIAAARALATTSQDDAGASGL